MAQTVEWRKTAHRQEVRCSDIRGLIRRLELAAYGRQQRGHDRPYL